MNRRDRVRVEHINRVGQFGLTNAADWTPQGGAQPTPAQTKTIALYGQLNTPQTGIVVILEGFETGRETGATGYHGGTTSKASVRNGIMLDLKDWNEAAAAIASDQNRPEIMEGFRIPHGVSTEAFAAKVNAIVAAATPLEADFIALGFADDFLTAMTARVEDFENATDDKETGLQSQTGAHGGMSATIREGLKVTKQLNVLMKNLYKTVPEKLAAWTTAAHIQRVGTSGKSKPPGGPTPPPNP